MQSIISHGRPRFVLHAPHLISPLCCRILLRGFTVNLTDNQTNPKSESISKKDSLYLISSPHQHLDLWSRTPRFWIPTRCRCGLCGEGWGSRGDSKRRKRRRRRCHCYLRILLLLLLLLALLLASLSRHPLGLGFWSSLISSPFSLLVDPSLSQNLIDRGIGKRPLRFVYVGGEWDPVSVNGCKDIFLIFFIF